MVWLTQSLRITLFFQPNAESPPKSPTFKDLWEAEPEQTLRRQLMFAEMGTVGGQRIQVSSQLPLRADLAIVPVEGAEMTSISIPSLGEPSEAIARVREIAERFVAMASPITRLAVGMVALTPTSSRAESYKAIRTALHRQTLDLEGVHDLLIQINRHAESKAAPGVTINRMGKWAGVISSIQVRDSAGRTSTTPEMHGMQIEADVNTDADHQDVLPKAQLPGLLDELFRYVEKLTADGEPE